LADFSVIDGEETQLVAEFELGATEFVEAARTQDEAAFVPQSGNGCARGAQKEQGAQASERHQRCP